MEDLDTQLRPLCEVLARVNASNPGVGANVALYVIDGVQRPVVVVFGKPWVVWLYIDSGKFMLRGGYPTDRILHSPRPAAVAVGRVGTALYDVQSKMIDMACQLAAEVPEQPADKYTWIGACGYVSQMEGKYERLPAQYNELRAPLVNAIPAPQSVAARTLPPVPVPRGAPVFVQRAAAPLEAPAPDEETDGRPVAGPAPKRSGRLPGIAGAAALLLAVLPLDYSMYGLIRWVVFVAAIWLVTVAANRKEYGWMCGYAVVAVIWNPLLPFGFSRASWLTPDLMGAAMMAFGAYAFAPRRREPTKS